MTGGKSYEFYFSVPFHDLDPMHVVWHGNCIKYFDQARFGLFKECGIDLYRYSLDNKCFFPVTKTWTKHIFPLYYADDLICRATVREASIKIVIDFAIRRSTNGVICIKGQGEQVAVKHPEMETLLEIPFEVRSALGFGE